MSDQQLYRTAIDVQWTHEDLISNLIPTWGGMHMLMSFVGVIGKLMMTEAGLSNFKVCLWRCKKYMVGEWL